jgi:hypothetical protein
MCSFNRRLERHILYRPGCSSSSSSSSSSSNSRTAAALLPPQYGGQQQQPFPAGGMATFSRHLVGPVAGADSWRLQQLQWASPGCVCCVRHPGEPAAVCHSPNRNLVTTHHTACSGEVRSSACKGAMCHCMPAAVCTGSSTSKHLPQRTGHLPCNVVDNSVPYTCFGIL